MANNIKAAIDFAHENQTRYVKELTELVRIPSVSTDPVHKPDMQIAAEWVADKLRAIGMENVKVMPTDGHPVVYADHLNAGKDAKTVVIYGHYDVQPAEPLELWNTEPFNPVLKDGKLIGRGASDMKGQVMASINAVEALMQNGGLGVNIKWFIEGEEEVGSPNLPAFINKNKKLLACDFALNPDGGIIGPDTPSIIYALRGLAYFQIDVEGPDHDLHSGQFGGSVLNPANELARLIGGMIDDNGHITLPGFYDKVRELNDEERQELSRLPTDVNFYLEQTGVPVLHGEKGYTPIEQTGARPTLDVNGFLSGFTGEGSKTVLPAKAMAKVSCRLVPDQDPEEIEKSLRTYLERNARKGIKWTVRNLTGSRASITPRDSEGMQALSAAMETVWGKRPVYKREGGSVPVVTHMQEMLGIESVMTGFGLPDDNLHAPNEKLTLAPWYMGIDTLIHFFHNIAG